MAWRREFVARHAPAVLSLVAGMAAWEIVGRHTDAAFLVPLSETLERLWQLAQTGELTRQTLSSLAIFFVGFALALIPFILSLMGFGFAPKVLVVFLFAVFPVLYNTVEGARSLKPELVEVAR